MASLAAKSVHLTQASARVLTPVAKPAVPLGGCVSIRCIVSGSQTVRRHTLKIVMRSQASEAGQVAPEGQVSSTLMDSMAGSIKEALEAQKVEVTDVYGDGRHVKIEVISSQFEGKSQMNRQRMVYKAIWLELQDAVHAVDAMVTMTPAEAGNN